jgi:starch synthase (maltosyl-transferring)
VSEIPAEGRLRAVIENVSPSVDGGRFAVKRVLGDTLVVQADVFADGHDEVRAVLAWSREADEWQWQTVEMEPLGNDRWEASFKLAQLGRYHYTVTGWVDHWRTWVHDLAKRVEAGQDVTVDLQIGARIIEAAAARAKDADKQTLTQAAANLTATSALDPKLAALVDRYPDLAWSTTLDAPLVVTVDPVRARFSAWYELFPRSASPDPTRHGTFEDVVARLDYVAGLGFDVLYLPPVSPIGRQFRKGANNEPSLRATDPGVPWAVGGSVGGHTAVHPELGDLAGFDRLVHAARQKGIEVALDIAFQASPDHPWVTEHPEWFRARPDGTIQYAENPPKKYQDIYPFDFESSDWRALWQALNGVFRFWLGHGVTIFRVDNPHTKALSFWEWCIADLKSDHPEALFLAEAFTRPKVMYRLAKAGFSQSYTYFTWRNNAAEMEEYLTEITRPPVSDFFRPNFWPNTPDILHADLQTGGPAAFEARLVLAAGLSSNYGIYGPAFELGESVPREPGSEEYLDSEKYQQRTWELTGGARLRGLIARVNVARNEHAALQTNERLLFHPADNPNLLAWSKNSPNQRDVVLGVVNFDYHATQGGAIELDLAALGLDEDAPFEAVDILDDQTYTWRGARAFVELDPDVRAAHLFWLRRLP